MEVDSTSSQGEEQSFSFSLFPPLPVDASAELSRMQGVINDLQRELAQFAASSTNGSHKLRRRVNGVSPPHNQPSVLMSELIEEAHAKRPRIAKNGLTGSRIGETSNADHLFSVCVAAVGNSLC